MTILARLEGRADARPVPDTMLRRAPSLQTAPSERRQRLSTAELAFRIYAVFRAHPHISNVLTHISRAKWPEVEQALNLILDAATTSDRLSPLEQNVIDLMCAERGITGKILKPYFHGVLYRLLERNHAERLIRHVEGLFLDLEWKAQHPSPPAPAAHAAPKESGHERSQHP